MNELLVFKNSEFGEIRTVVINGEPWFVGKDVATALGYKNTNQSVIDNTDEDERGRSPIMTPSGIQSMVVINESGLYSMIFGSRLQTAKHFKKWVTSEVLPSIRKTGGYEIKKPDSYAIEDPVARAERWIEEQKERKALSEKVEELTPKAHVYDKMLDSKLLVNFRDAAKEIGISQSQFTGWLEENGYIYATSSGELRPMEQYRASGLFEMKPYQNPYNGYCGSRTFITPRGLAAFKIILDTAGYNQDTMKKHGGKKKKTV